VNWTIAVWTEDMATVYVLPPALDCTLDSEERDRAISRARELSGLPEDVVEGWLLSTGIAPRFTGAEIVDWSGGVPE
jgi:hypothetical protein